MRILNYKPGETEEQYRAREKAEKRIEQRTPAAITRRNRDKSSGILSFAFSEDGSEVRVWNYRKLRPAEQLVLALLADDGGKLYDSESGGLIAVFKLKDPAKVRATLKLAQIPERCERCEGAGEIKNPIPSWSSVIPRQETGEREADYNVRVAPDVAAYRKKYGRGPEDGWTSIVRCPICRGTGRAVTLESDE